MAARVKMSWMVLEKILEFAIESRIASKRPADCMIEVPRPTDPPEVDELVKELRRAVYCAFSLDVSSVCTSALMAERTVWVTKA